MGQAGEFGAFIGATSAIDGRRPRGGIGQGNAILNLQQSPLLLGDRKTTARTGDQANAQVVHRFRIGLAYGMNQRVSQVFGQQRPLSLGFQIEEVDNDQPTQIQRGDDARNFTCCSACLSPTAPTPERLRSRPSWFR